MGTRNTQLVTNHPESHLSPFISKPGISSLKTSAFSPCCAFNSRAILAPKRPLSTRHAAAMLNLFRPIADNFLQHSFIKVIVIMDANTIVERLLEDSAALHILRQPLPDEVAAIVVERLKAEADRHWAINANRSLEIADMIVQIGRTRDDVGQVALGTMARGDALKFLGHVDEAWIELEQAGQTFQMIGDEVGWARTCIGKIYLSVGLNRVSQALVDIKRARSIFIFHNEHEKLLRLDLNTAIVYDLLGDFQKALALYYRAIPVAQSLGTDGETYLAALYTNVGFAYESLGNFRQALVYQEYACTLFHKLGEVRNLAIAETNSAIIAIKQGYYRHALDLLYRVHGLYVSEKLPRDATEVNRIIVECYLLLNRYKEARDLARQVIVEFQDFGEAYEEALTLIELALAEAQLGQLELAQAALNAAGSIFTSLNADEWVATTQLRRGRIALQEKDSATAKREAIAATGYFHSGGQQVKYATAKLLYGQAALAEGDLFIAKQASAEALQIAKRNNVPALRYTAHLLLGRVAEAQGNLMLAARRYYAATATIERVQRHLTITLRPGFLEDKEEASRALLTLLLRSGDAKHAFETLERAKSQVLLSHLTNREQLRWSENDARTRMLIEELDRLRAEHQWFYELAHDEIKSDDNRSSAISPEQALVEVAARERRMRAITEQLYLQSGGGVNRTRVLSLPHIQQCLDQDTLLIEFYNDGSTMWVFTLDAATLEVQQLSVPVAEVDRLLTQWQVNLAAALKSGPSAPVTHNLANLAQRMLGRLYRALLEPIQQRLQGRQRLLIVPYGLLHYLPFHLLHTGTAYLIEQYEVVVLPAAGLVTQRGPVRVGGARILTHSWDGRLPQTLAEARIVRHTLGGDLYCEQDANRATLRAQPTQVLHIAAHGQHRLDQPDLSYIQLADGQLYTDDLLQHDLSYELVTLSACETGRANVAPGDELIGLGRGFLYAGAGALIVSLWRVTDDAALAVMKHMYRDLHAGVSKAAALRNAQCALLAAQPQLHPAFWGAFQLVGDACPLSTTIIQLDKEQEDVVLEAEA